MVKKMGDEWLAKIYRGEHIPCSVIHDHSCEWNAARKFWLVFSMAYKFYVPIHFLPALIFKKQRLLKEPIKILKACIINIIRSSLFISTYVCSFWYMCFVFRNKRMRTEKWIIIYAGFICSFAILFEPAHRRTELALYMFPRFLESMFLFLEKRGYVKSIKNGEVLVFAFALGIIMYCYQNEEKKIKSTYLSMFKKYWGTN